MTSSGVIFRKWTVLAALTRFQTLTVGCVAAESDSVPLIRQLLCSALCSEFLNYEDCPPTKTATEQSLCSTSERWEYAFLAAQSDTY